MKKITELAGVIRSKNAGPFELTLDIIFKDVKAYEAVRDQKLINAQRIAELYGVERNQVKKIIFFDPSHAVKISMKRPIPSGAPGDGDIYGAQQHAPLLQLEFDI